MKRLFAENTIFVRVINPPVTMKKTYLLLSFLCVGTLAFSQNMRQQALVATPTQADCAAAYAPARQSVKAPAATVAAQANRGGTPALWSEDFGNGFPAGWAVDDASGINPWKWSTNGSHGNFNSSQGAGYDNPLSSTTAANGFLINDPDSANHFTYGQPSGSTYQYLDSYFATSRIDLGASYPSLLLEFEQHFRMNNNVDLVVQVSTDSTNWTDYTVGGSVANNSASDDPDLVSINISGTVGNAQSLYLRIGWSARVYFWMIDDMRIVEGSNHDLAMLDVWHGDIFNAFEYERIPLAQAQELVVGAACINQGGVPQTNTVYTYDVSLGTNSVASGTFAANATSIASTATDTTWFATGFTPTQTGIYTVTVTVEADSIDEVLSNNQLESSFIITENIYGHDDEDNITLQISGGVNDNEEANEYKIAMFYEIFADATLTSVQTAFANNTTTESCIVEVFDPVNDQTLSSPLITEVYDLVPGDISPGAVPSYVNIVLNDGDGIDLQAGGIYLISIGNTGEGEDLWFLASEGDQDQAQRRYGPFGTGGAINWYRGYTTSPLIRANFDPTVGINEQVLEQNGFGVYPNPATSALTIQLHDEKEVENIAIMDVTGKLVKEVTARPQAKNITTDVSNLPAGMYLVRVVSKNGMHTQKLIIE